MYLTRDLLNQKYWNAATVGAVITNMPWTPSYLRNKNLFKEVNVATNTVYLEQVVGSQELIQSTPSGGAVPQLQRPKGAVSSVRTTKITQGSTITADHLKGVVAAGSDALMKLEDLRTQTFSALDVNVSFTEENHFLGALNGKVLDADGVTVLIDLHDAFKVTPNPVQSFSRGTEAIKKSAQKVVKVILDALGMIGGVGVKIEALCGDEFYAFVSNAAETKEAFNRWNDGAFLRNGGLVYQQFEYAGVLWTNYRGANSVHMGTDEAIFFPDQDGLGYAFYGPSDRFDDGLGQSRYAFADVEKNKLIECELQANLAAIFSRPDAVVKGKLGA